MSDREMQASSPAHFKALAHVTRQRLLFELGEPATISQLAHTLGTHKGNIAHHLKVLCDAGLVVLASTRHVRGGTERYYKRAARTLITVGEESHASRAITLQAVAAEIGAGPPEPLLLLRHLRLTADQRDHITTLLTELAHDTQAAARDQPRYGLLLALYEQAGAASPKRSRRSRSTVKPGGG